MNFNIPENKFAELHLHFGGAVTPEQLWEGFQGGSNIIFDDFMNFFTEEKDGLASYLRMHKMVSSLQNRSNLKFFIDVFIKSALRQDLAYVEIRHCPYLRTTRTDPEDERIKEMSVLVNLFNDTIYNSLQKTEENTLKVTQILCLHSGLTKKVNEAIVDLAIELNRNTHMVCGIDIAGGEVNYRPKEILTFFKKAKANGLRTTAHIFETKECPVDMLDLLPYLDRIGHGVHIPLMHENVLNDIVKSNIAFEICPTTYFKCGVFSGYSDRKFKKIFEVLTNYHIPIIIGTDNGGLHRLTLKEEHDRLLNNNVISTMTYEELRLNGFRHSFAYYN